MVPGVATGKTATWTVFGHCAISDSPGVFWVIYVCPGWQCCFIHSADMFS